MGGWVDGGRGLRTGQHRPQRNPHPLSPTTDSGREALRRTVPESSVRPGDREEAETAVS